jgi:hypothetical protein
LRQTGEDGAKRLASSTETNTDDDLCQSWRLKRNVPVLPERRRAVFGYALVRMSGLVCLN